MKKRLAESLFVVASTIFLPISCTPKTEIKYYNVTFANYDGTPLEKKLVEKGHTPSFTKETPTKEEDDQYRYKFTEWSPALSPVYKDTTYIAQYRSINKCIVIWTDSKGKEIKTDTDADEESIHYTGTVPVKEKEGDQYYYFAGWKLVSTSVNCNDNNNKQVYTVQAQFEPCKESDDRDYDGLVDYLDPSPLVPSFNAELNYSYGEELANVKIKNADFNFNYKKMFVDAKNNEYSKDLAKFSAILCSNDKHGTAKLTEDVKPVKEFDTIYNRLGFNDSKLIETSESSKDPNDQAKAAVYYQQINSKTYNQVNNVDDIHDLFIIKLDYGVLSLYEEWESNIDIGINDEEYFNKEGDESKHEQAWLDNSNFYKSFFVAANRIKPLLIDYIANKKTTNEPIILLTGHSRCGSIANVLGMLLNKDNTFNKKLFVYAFAPCHTYWGDVDSENNNIFNICNNDDMVTLFPFNFITENDKKLNRLGITKSLSIGNSLIKTYQNRTNSDYAYIKNANKILFEYLNGITRKDLYTCNNVTKLKKSKNTYVQIIKRMNPHLSDEQFEKYFVFEQTNNGLTIKTCLESYAHAILGLVGDGHLPKDDQMNAAIELVSNYYSLALSLYMNIVGEAVYSVALPHYMTSYYLLANSID